MKKLLKQSANILAARFGPHQSGYASSAPRLWVLMYHRILPASDPRHASEEPGMIVTPTSFRQQLQTIKKLFDVMPLIEWVERRAQGKPLPARACAVTFDDGWLDNFEYALPVLQAEQVPATVFAVADMVGTARQFWPNRLARILTTPGLDHDQTAFAWLQQLPGYSASATLTPEAIATLVHACKKFSDPELAANLERMETAIALPPLTSPALMDWPQLRQLQASGLIDIGSHTRHHYRLVENLPAAILHDEVVGSRSQLENMLDRPVKLFCYPNGNVSRAAAKLVAGHFAAAVTTQKGINTTASPLHTLTRIGIHEDISDTSTRFRARLSGWI
ncbi:MAG TPA: polysaccharide deacetylase family protein [Spongiibacteraceae bacterium]|nr:polysaccharide deacetylase family protein [Spongiibacteraceae bacterium]